MKALVLAFAFTLSLPAFGGLTITVTAPDMPGCLEAREAARKQLMLAGLPVSVTTCTYVDE